MSTFVYYQLYIFLATFYGGVVIGFLYDLYKIYRRILNPSKIVEIIQDLLFWLVITVVAIAVLLYSNDGSLRWYTFLGFIIGALIYNILLSSIVVKIVNKFLMTLKRFWNYIYIKIKNILGHIIEVIKLPYKLIKKIMKPYLNQIKRIINLPRDLYGRLKGRLLRIFVKK